MAKKCPRCNATAETERGLVKHLRGEKKYGGHELPERQATRIADETFHGAYPAAAASGPAAREPEAKEISVAEIGPEVMNDPYGAFLARYFRTLAADKKLPKYQFERRVDAMIAIFLPEILKALRGWEVEAVVPEFPLKKPGNNQSTNADCLLFRHAGGPAGEAWILFELKTDTGSVRQEQLETYRAAMDRGMPGLLADLEAIAAASTAGPKYAQLQSRVARFPADRPIELLYLAPARVEVPDGRGLALTFRELEALALPGHALVWDLFRRLVLPHMEE